ncbi:hypothetical protein ACHAO1_001919 [Botrytis cinerea]
MPSQHPAHPTQQLGPETSATAAPPPYLDSALATRIYQSIETLSFGFFLRRERSIYRGLAYTHKMPTVGFLVV